MDIIQIKWDGPYNLNEIKNFDNPEDYGLYQIYGYHVNGNKSLLYIGKAEKQTFSQRILQHDPWLGSEPDSTEIYLGRLGDTYPVETEEDLDDWEKKISAAEKLLIYHIHPPKNSSGLNNYGSLSETIVLNYGKRCLLPMEISTYYKDSGYNNENWEVFSLPNESLEDEEIDYENEELDFEDDNEAETEFELVENIDQAIENVKIYNREIIRDTQSSKALKALIPFVRHWYYIKELDMFAPSKFIGYVLDTEDPVGYYLANNTNGMTGTYTEVRLRKWFINAPIQQKANLEVSLVNFLNNLGRKPNSGFVIHIQK